MKKIFAFLFIVIMGFGFSFAHDNDSGKREKIFREVQEYKMKYLAQEMDLSEVQKKKFFEIYEEMEKSRHECFRNAVKMDRKLKKNPDASEEDYRQATEALNQANAEWAEKEKKYNESLAEFLTQKQIYKMKEAEMSFKGKLDEMSHKKKQGHSHKGDKKEKK